MFCLTKKLSQLEKMMAKQAKGFKVLAKNKLITVQMHLAWFVVVAKLLEMLLLPIIYISKQSSSNIALFTAGNMEVACVRFQ